MKKIYQFIVKEFINIAHEKFKENKDIYDNQKMNNYLELQHIFDELYNAFSIYYIESIEEDENYNFYD